MCRRDTDKQILSILLMKNKKIIRTQPMKTEKNSQKCQKNQANTHGCWIFPCLPMSPHVKACHLMSLNGSLYGSKCQFIWQ